LKASDLLEALARKLGTNSQTELARAIGVSVGTLINWKNRDEDLSPNQIASAIAKSQSAAIEKSQLETIQPVVEFYGIERCRTDRGASWQVFDAGSGATLYAQGLKAALNETHGIYIFYDSRGHSIYVGKAREQTIWKEMNSAFNRKREVQTIALVDHPDRNQVFKPGYEKLRQPKATQLELFDMARYFSAYSVDDGMIEDLEALLVRGFANDLLNVKMETFAHSRK
jgi:DNA-binding XRE family transcriptional regulator